MVGAELSAQRDAVNGVAFQSELGSAAPFSSTLGVIVRTLNMFALVVLLLASGVVLAKLFQHHDVRISCNPMRLLYRVQAQASSVHVLKIYI